jgi:beta-lactamase regulating signal transducer with metallopeptidase domain
VSRVFVLYLFSLTLRSAVLAAVVGLVLFRSKSVVLRHAALTVTLFLMFLMPVADALMPATLVSSAVPEIVPIQSFRLITSSAQTAAVVPEETVKASQAMDWWRLSMVLIVIVACALLFRFARAYFLIRRLRRNSRSVFCSTWEDLQASTRPGFRGVSIRESSEVTVPLTIGFWRPLLILPAHWRSWDEWTQRAVLMHELTHVRREDWGIAMMAAIAKCVFWFNPLAWWLERKLSSLAEQASDEACVRFFGDPQRYAKTLLHFAAAARHGYRWIGGVSMAQHKISLRIERILELVQPGPGTLSRAGWATIALIALPTLVVLGSPQSGGEPIPLLPSLELRQFLPQVPAPPQTTSATVQQAAPAPGQQPAPPQSGVAAQGNPVSPAPAQGVPNPGTAPPAVNPDLVGEIRLILAPVEGAAGGQVQSPFGQNRYPGTAVWNVRNTAAPNAWGSNPNAFSFALSGINGRNLLFENSAGGTYSYGCADCSVLVWDSGVGTPSASTAAGIIFRLSPDGKSVSATCRATECQALVSMPNGVLGNQMAYTMRGSETTTYGAVQGTGAANSTLTCFSIFGNLKQDGTAFTSADCPGGTAVVPSRIFFSVKR